MLAAVIVLSIIVLGFLFRMFYNLGYAQAQQDARNAVYMAEYPR